MSKTKVLNLYAGIGGNRKLWDNVDVTAVEWDEEKAEVYRDHFPDDEVVVTDAHEYLTDHLYDGWDFIWTSPPCPTHSQLEKMNRVINGPRYPDMKLWQEIVLLRSNQGIKHKEHGVVDYDYVVENVDSYYDPFIKPQKVGRHYFWSNFPISNMEVESLPIRSTDTSGNRASFDVDTHQESMGFDLSGYEINKSKRDKMLKNCVNPKLGKHVFDAATKNRQATLF